MKNEYTTLIEKYWDHQASEQELLQIKELMETDAEFRDEFVEACRLSGMISAATHDDLDCKVLADLVDVAIGDGKSAEFEDRVLDSIDKLEKPGGRKPVKGTDTRRYRLSGKRSSAAKKRPVSKSGSKLQPLFWLAVASIAIVSGIVLVMQSKNGFESGRMTVAQVVGSESKGVVYRGDSTQQIGAGFKLCHNDMLACASGTKVVVQYPDGTKIELQSQTRISFGRTIAGGKKICLEQGVLDAAVAKQPTGKDLVISAPEATATVIGTVFKLSALDGQSSLVVREGVVGFRRHSDQAYTKVPANYYAMTSWAEFVARPIRQTHSVATPTQDSKPTTTEVKVIPVATVIRFSLIDAATGKAINGFESIHDGMVIDMNTVKANGLNIVAHTRPEKVTSVICTNEGPDGKKQRVTEQFHPYAIFMDSLNTGGTYHDWQPANGTYKISATPFLNGKEGKALRVTFKVTNSPF